MSTAVGDRLAGAAGHYLLEATHASGGFGLTYLARREEDGRPVLVKVLRLDRMKEWKSLDLFHREARVLRQLSHPGIPAYLDELTLGPPDAPEGFALVQELVPGTDLARLARAGERPARAQLLDWLGQLLRVLDYLHRQSPPVIHRDISPKNVVRRSDGAVVLVDFGSVQAALRQGQSVASTAAGTFGFAPLEQFVGRATPASDLYALGMTFLSIASGRQPEEMPIDGIRVNTRALLPDDPGLAALLEAMTAPDPRERLGDASLALQRLAALSDPSRASPAKLPAARPVSSARRIALLTATLALVMFVALEAYWTFLGATGTYYLVYAADRNGDLAWKAYHRQGSVVSGEVVLRTAAGAETLRRSLPTDAYPCALSGRVLTYFTRDERDRSTTFWTASLAGGAPVARVRTSLPNRWETCALRGDKLAIESDDVADQVRVMVQEGDGALAPAPGTLPGDHHPDWSPDGKTLVVSRQEDSGQTLAAIDLTTGTRQALTTRTGPQHQDIRPVFAPGGERIAFYRSSRRTYGDGANRQTSAAFDLYVLDLAAREARLLLQDVCFAAAPAWAGPQAVAFGKWTGRHCGLFVYDLETAEERLVGDDY